MSLAKDILLTAAVLVCCLLLFEGCLRVAGVKYDSSLYRLDRELGYVLRPGAEGWSVKERDSYERVSSQGLRDRAHSVQRPSNVIRIAFVGDSFAEAKQVDQDAAYWSVMERELNRRLPAGGPRIEVINFGVAGYGLAQEYLVIKQKIWAFDPQIVILSGTLHSLILHSSRKFGTASDEGPVPYFEDRGGGLALDDLTLAQRRSFEPPTPLSEWVGDATNSSRLLSLVNAVRRKITSEAAGFRHRLTGTAAVSPKEAVDFENMSLRGPADPDLAQAWSVSEGLLRLARREAGLHHAEFWFFLLDMAPQVDPDLARRESAKRNLGIEDLFFADKLFADFATREGILHEMLAPKMLSFAEANRALLHGFPGRPVNSGHWNETGHRVAGEFMAEELLNCSKIIRDSNPGRAGNGPPACSDDYLR